jgi:hypothetical protein
MPALLVFALLLALPLTLGIAGLLSRRYGHEIQRLMNLAPAPADAIDNAPISSSPQPSDLPARVGALEGPAVLPSLRELRAQESRLWGCLVALSLVVGLSAAWLYLLTNGLEVLPRRWLLTGLVMATPGLVMQMQLMRWPMGRQAGAIGLGSAALSALVALASGGEANLWAILGWILPQVLISLLVFRMLYGIPRLKALAPVLATPVLMVVVVALLGQQLLAHLVSAGSDGPLGGLVATIGATATLLLFSLLPVLAGGATLAHRLTAILGAWYRARRFSNLSYLYGASWLLILLGQALLGWSSTGNPGALGLLLAWLWIPLFFGWIAGRLIRPVSGNATALLVLRVFRQEGPIARLFEQVAQRWRSIGPVLLISGADLASRTVDPHELVDFLEGRLQERYIADRADLKRQLAAIENRPDHDGRYRVNEFSCYATTWREVLDSLLARSRAVLLDLRDFSARNLGCRYELERISRCTHLAGVLVLVNDATDRQLAEELLGSPPPGAVHWIREVEGRLPGGDALLRQLLEA